MRLGDYQEACRSTRQYPSQYSVIYPAIGLAGEAGELLNKLKKHLRGDPDVAMRDDMISELGDILWYCSALADDLKVSLDRVAQQNLDKLARRKATNSVRGSGDNR